MCYMYLASLNLLNHFPLKVYMNMTTYKAVSNSLMEACESVCAEMRQTIEKYLNETLIYIYTVYMYCLDRSWLKRHWYFV